MSFLDAPENLLTIRDMVRLNVAIRRIEIRENRLHRKLLRWLKGQPWHIDPWRMLDGRL